MKVKRRSPEDEIRGTTNNTNEVPGQSLTSITIGISVAGTFFFVAFVILAILSLYGKTEERNYTSAIVH